jgi:biofilm PGA synthesis N-glycosyltransferase PgaC
MTKLLTCRARNSEDYFTFTNGQSVNMASVVVLTFFIAYAGFTILLTAGWRLAAKLSMRDRGSESDQTPFISIVVAARNEEQCLPRLINDLRGQQYSSFEVIIVDDHSEDCTSAICRRATEHDSRFRHITSNGIGKKAALSLGVGISQGSLIVTTDADCRVGPLWVAAWSKTFTNDSVMFGFGAVTMSGPTMFDRIQAMEFATLVGSGAATATWGKPTMCNGANLAYRKEAFVAVEGYLGNEKIPSGDDEFLMRKIGHRFPGSIRYCADTQALVTTRAAATLSKFIQQRVRWAGKWKGNTSKSARMLAIGVLCFHLCVLALPMLVFTHAIMPSVALFCILIKFLSELIFVFSLRPIILPRWSWAAFFSLQLLYSGYVVFVALWSQFSDYEWKGRRLKPFMASSN